MTALATLLIHTGNVDPLSAQTAYPSAKSLKISAEDHQKIVAGLAKLQSAVAKLKQGKHSRSELADVEIFAKAAEWTLRHNEFFTKDHARYTLDAIDHGLKRAAELSAGKPTWLLGTGKVVLGYYSKVDGSVQPYVVSLPNGFDIEETKRWPMQVELHGRGSTLNEVRFFERSFRSALPEDQDWIHLAAFGRTNNAYRWSGETDVLEAIADARRRFRVDHRRVTLWGFSMGGAGSWHLGLHHPSKWSSVGPGAGFVDFYKYQKQTEQLPIHQHKTLKIYDAIDYAQNAANVPICTYGGEFDAQLVASTEVVEKAKKLGVEIKMLIGPGVGHKFHPDSFKEFMAFHRAKSKTGRPGFPGNKNIHFATYTLKYNQCDWLTIEEMPRMYEQAVVKSEYDRNSGILKVKTKNVAVLQLAREVSDLVEIDGTVLPLNSAAEGLLPGVYYEKTPRGWVDLSYAASRSYQDNTDGRKRHNLQGPIDDAFMEPFVCVSGTGEAWSTDQQQWSGWTLKLFEKEFDKWLRGKVPVVKDIEVTDELTKSKNLILFGDPGSNSVIAKVLDGLPIKWTKDEITVAGKTYSTKDHGLSMIFPNPLNPRKYVVINSGHTFHEKSFLASNSWLFPRLGDIAVQKFTKKPTGGYEEEIVFAELFNESWQLPTASSSTSK